MHVLRPYPAQLQLARLELVLYSTGRRGDGGRKLDCDEGAYFCHSRLIRNCSRRQRKLRLAQQKPAFPDPALERLGDFPGAHHAG